MLSKTISILKNNQSVAKNPSTKLWIRNALLVLESDLYYDFDKEIDNIKYDLGRINKRGIEQVKAEIPYRAKWWALKELQKERRA